MTTTPAQPEPPVLPPFDGVITPLIRSLARALNIESVDAAVGEGDLHLAARLAQHMAQPEPSTVLLALRDLYNAEDDSREKDAAYDVIHAALAARPAPVVSAGDVGAAALLIHNRRNHNQDTSPGYCGGLRADEIGRVREVLAALGITVADTPAADDEGGQGR